MFFFFSSRRRHTRSKRDWSSDVCSSDLAHGGRLPGRTAHRHRGLIGGRGRGRGDPAGLGRGGIRARGPAPARFSPALSAALPPALSAALSATLLPAPSPGPFSRSSPRTVLSPRCRAASRKQLHHRYREFDHVRVDSNTEAIEGVVRVADTATG